MLNKTFFLRTFLVAFSLLLLMSGCSSQPKSVPKPTKEATVPSWFLNPPQDNANYMYGVAMGKNRDEAVKGALADMVSKLSINLKSSYSSDQKANNYYTKMNISNKIQTDIASIKINNYAIIQTQMVGYTRYAVLIRTDKRQFVSGLIDTLGEEKSRLNLQLKELKNKDAIGRYNALKKMFIQTRKMKHTLSIINELKNSIPSNKKFNKLSYIADMVRVQQRFSDEKSRLKFYVQADGKSSIFVNTIKNFLVSKGLDISSIQDKNSVVIGLKSADNLYKSNYFDIAVIHLNLQIISDAMIVGGRAFTFKERYVGSMKKAYQSANFDLQKEIRAHTLNDAIGLDLE